MPVPNLQLAKGGGEAGRAHHCSSALEQVREKLIQEFQIQGF
jgi:hypothetical protein